MREAKANEDNYLLYLHKREEARIEEALDRTRILNVGMVEQPTVPIAPVRSAVDFQSGGIASRDGREHRSGLCAGISRFFIPHSLGSFVGA